jgi:hypothetical protein
VRLPARDIRPASKELEFSESEELEYIVRDASEESLEEIKGVVVLHICLFIVIQTTTYIQ